MTAPQLVRDASVASVTRWQELPAPGLETKTKGFLHMSKTRKHRRVTLIIQSGFSPRGESLGFEPPLYGSHVQQAKKYHVGRSWHQTQQFLKLLTVIDRPSLTLLTDVRIDSIRAGDIRACIVVGSPPRPDKWFSVLKKHTFLTLSLNPNSFKWTRTASALMI